LLRGQEFIRFKLHREITGAEHAVRRMFIRVSGDDFTVFHCYKAVCARVAGSDARLRFPPTERAEGQYEDYVSPFYDDTTRCKPHPLNRDSIYTLDAESRCSLTGRPVPKHVIVNGFKYTYARSIPIAHIVEVSYGLLRCKPTDVIESDAHYFVTQGSMGRTVPILTRPTPPPDALPPYFTLEPEHLATTVPGHPGAIYAHDEDRCWGCSMRSSPAAVWREAGRHSGEDRCNCPRAPTDDCSSQTRLAEDLVLFGQADIHPERCLTVMLSPQFGSLLLQAPSSLTALIWIKLLVALKRYYTVPMAVHRHIRIDEYFYAPTESITAARKIDDLFSLLPSTTKEKDPQSRSVWECLLMSSLSIPTTGARYEALRPSHPLVDAMAAAVRAEAARIGNPRLDPLVLLQQRYARGALELSRHPTSTGLHLQRHLAHRLAVAGAYFAVFVLPIKRGKRRMQISAPHTVFIRLSPDCSTIFYNDASRGTIRQGAPMASCCAILEGSASPLYGLARHPLTLRFAATRAVMDSLGPLASASREDPLSVHFTNDMLRSHGPSVLLDAHRVLQCHTAPEHTAHVDVNLAMLDFPVYTAWHLCFRWLIWAQSRTKILREMCKTTVQHVDSSVTPHPLALTVPATPVSAAPSSASSEARRVTAAASPLVAFPLLPSEAVLCALEPVRVSAPGIVLGAPVPVAPVWRPDMAPLLVVPLMSVEGGDGGGGGGGRSKVTLLVTDPADTEAWTKRSLENQRAASEAGAVSTKQLRRQLCLHSSLAVAELTPQVRAEVRAIITDPHRPPFAQLFRVSHVIYDDRFGALLLAVLRPLGLGVVLKRVDLGVDANEGHKAMASDAKLIKHGLLQQSSDIYSGYASRLPSFESSGEADRDVGEESPRLSLQTRSTASSSSPDDGPGTGCSSDSDRLPRGPRSPGKRDGRAPPPLAVVSEEPMMPMLKRAGTMTPTHTAKHIHTPSPVEAVNPFADPGSRLDAEAPWRALFDIEKLDRMVSIDDEHVMAHMGYFFQVPPAVPRLFIIVELVDMGPLSDLLRWRPALGPVHVAYIARGVLQGLQALHRHRLPHGELCARYVLLNRRGDVKIGGLLAGELREVSERATRKARAATAATEAATGVGDGENKPLPPPKAERVVSCSGAGSGSEVHESRHRTGAVDYKDDADYCYPAPGPTPESAPALLPAFSVSKSTTRGPGSLRRGLSSHRSRSLSAQSLPIPSPDSCAVPGGCSADVHSPDIDPDAVLRDPTWLAPETGHRAAATAAADVWAFGVLLLELISGSSRPQVLEYLAREITAAKGEQQVRLSGGRATTIPAAAVDMIRLCLRRDPAERPDVGTLLQHPMLWPDETMSAGDAERKQFAVWLEGVVGAKWQGGPVKDDSLQTVEE
jgi:serine/threonine protein kinase